MDNDPESFHESQEITSVRRVFRLVELSAVAKPACFTAYDGRRISRDANGALLADMHDDGGPITFTAADHEASVEVIAHGGGMRACMPARGWPVIRARTVSMAVCA